MKKEYLILAVLAIGALAYYFLVYKKTGSPLDGPVSNDPFSIDDDQYYKIVRNLLPEKDRPWVDAEVAKVFGQTSNPMYVINGKPSKTATYIELVSMMSANPSGAYLNKAGTGKQLWPTQMLDNMWAQARNPLAAKYGGLA